MNPSAPKHFDAIAGQYAGSEVHAQSPTIARLHQLLQSRFPDSVCDVACGPGHLALSFGGKASRIVGVDAAPNMLTQFAKLARARGVPVETVHAYAEAMPLPDHSFEAVVSRLAPHHFPDPKKAIGEMARLAKRGGSVAVIDLQGNEDAILDALNHEIEVWHDATHVRSYTTAQWRAFFEASGLTVESLEADLTEIPAGLTIKRWCEIGSTPPEAEAKIRTRLAAAPPDHLVQLGIKCQDGEFTIPVRTCLVLGRKSP
jgi:ubiquinone/menaquinone biosynthesis C-methylase UbiE